MTPRRPRSQPPGTISAPPSSVYLLRCRRWVGGLFLSFAWGLASHALYPMASGPVAIGFGTGAVVMLLWGLRRLLRPPVLVRFDDKGLSFEGRHANWSDVVGIDVRETFVGRSLRPKLEPTAGARRTPVIYQSFVPVPLDEVLDEIGAHLDHEIRAVVRPPTHLAPLRRPFFAALAASALVFSFVRMPLPVATFEGPGKAVAVADRLRGAEPRPGSIFILAVSDAPATGLSLVRGALDSAVDVHWNLPWTRPATSRESDIVGRQLAEASAVVAASACVGRPVAFSGGGVIVTSYDLQPGGTGVIPAGDELVSADGRAVHGIENLYSAATARGRGTIALEARSADGAVHGAMLPVAVGDEVAPRIRGVSLERRPVVLGDVDGFPRVELLRLVQSSSGLASALGLVDATGPGPLAAGRRIAVTGTIGTDGVVGPILGLRFKAAAAQRAGASILLVPAGQAEFARRYAGAITVIGVNTLDDAVRALGGPGCQRD